MFLVILTTLTLLYTLIAWRDLRWALLLLAAALPTYLIRFDLLGIPLTWLEAMIAISTIVWLLKHRSPLIPLSRFWKISISLLLTSAIVSVFFSPDTLSALGALKAYFIEPLLVFFLIRQTFQTPKDKEYLIKSLAVGGTFIAIFGILQFFTGWGLPAPWDLEQRITSFFPYPNAIGLYLGPLFILGACSLHQAIKKTHKKDMLLWSVFLLLNLTAIILAKSEAALVAIPVTLFGASLFHKGLRRFSIPITTAVVLIILMVPTIRIPVIEKITLQDFSGEVRRTQWEETFLLLQDEPITGTGLAGYPQGFKPYHTRKEIEIFQYPHNILLNIWVELGVWGVLAFIFLAMTVLQTTWQTYRHGEKPNWIALASFVALTEMVIHGLVDVPYFKNDLATLTWILLAFVSLETSANYDRR